MSLWKIIKGFSTKISTGELGIRNEAPSSARLRASLEELGIN